MNPTRPRLPTVRALRFGLLACSAVLAGPASAQFYGYGYGYGGPYSYNAPPPGPIYGGPRYGGPYGGRPEGGDPERQVRTLRPGEVVDRLEDLGYDDVGRPRFTGTIYIVDATAPGDIRMRVVVDAVRGVVLNRTALGERREFRMRDDDDDDDRQPPQRLGARPPEPDLFGTPPGGRTTLPERRGTARALPGPADPRLAPSDERAARPFEGRSGSREAARTEPRGLPADPDARPFGTNPGGTAPARRPAEQQQQARRPAGPAAAVPPRPPAAPAPNQEGTRAPAADRPKASAEARPNRPVRVIGGVTPMAATPPPGEAPAGAAQLDALPPPPPVPAPSAQD